MSAKDMQRIMSFGSHEMAWTWLHELRVAMVRPEREPLANESSYNKRSLDKRPHDMIVQYKAERRQHDAL